jgi:methionyl-tRNA formyltransferase
MNDYKDLRIIFMGTPEFAVASLDKLVSAGCNIVGVVTAPDKPAGRGMQLQQSSVKKYAEEKGLQILQPEKLKDPGFIQALQSLKADLQIVVAFRMLPEVVWNMPPMGTVNVHGSLLPQYRGAAPINWAIINGEKYTGVTTFKLKHEIDTGDILLSTKINIGENETAGELHDEMKEAGATLLLKTIEGIAGGSLKETSQDVLSTGALHHAPKIFTETCRISWDMPVAAVHNLVRGLSPYPAAFSFLNNKKIKIFAAEKIDKLPAISPGEFETDQKTFLRFACEDGFISVLELQLEGKKRMGIQEFLRGFHFS